MSPGRVRPGRVSRSEGPEGLEGGRGQAGDGSQGLAVGRGGQRSVEDPQGCSTPSWGTQRCRAPSP